MWLISRAALLGAASGGRSLAGPAAVGLHGPARILALSAAAGELIVDKLPKAPSRLAPLPLAGRVALAGLAVGILARREHRNPVAPVLVASAAAIAGSVIGARWRSYAARRHWAALPVALAEDFVTYAVAATAGRKPALSKFRTS